MRGVHMKVTETFTGSKVPKGTKYLKNDTEIVSKAIKIIKCVK